MRASGEESVAAVARFEDVFDGGNDGRGAFGIVEEIDDAEVMGVTFC